MKLKKQLLVIPAIAILGMGTTLTFANNEGGTYEQIAIGPELVEQQKLSLFSSINGTVTQIIEDTETVEGETLYKIVLETEDRGNYWINVKEDTLFVKDGEIISIDDIQEEDNLIVSYEAMAAAPAIYPPRITATALVVANEEYNPTVHVDVFFTEGLISSDNFLRLTIDEDTVVVDTDNNVYEGSLENKKLAVIYGASTKSMPAIPMSPKVIVLGEADEVVGFEMFLEKFEIVEEVQKPIINMVDLLPAAARGNRNIDNQQDNYDIQDMSVIPDEVLTVEYESNNQ